MTLHVGNQNDAMLPNGGSAIQNGSVTSFTPKSSSPSQREPEQRSYWLAVASADHVRTGRQHGFMQVNHGKRAPLKRIRPGDGIVYYSPSVKMGEKDGFQSFTAIGFVREGEPYLAEMGCGKAYRKDVDWFDAPEQPLRPLLGWLDFTQDKNWGYKLRFGLVALGQSDFEFLQEILMSELEVVKRRRLQV